MRTSLCDRLGIDIPIIQAPIGGCASPQLAAAVSNAGALGTITLTGADPQAARQRIADVRAATSRPFCANFILALTGDYEAALDVALAEQVPVISMFWGDAAPFVDRVHAAGAILVLTVGSVEEARRAADAGVDIIVAQGWEAGGHVRGDIATLPLIPGVVDAVAPTPVVAAGGIADGRGLAAVLVLGAAGAWIGTRFLASTEAATHPVYRDRIVQGTAADTVHTELFDVGWPDAPHRVLRNTTYNDWVEAGRPPHGKRPGEHEVLATDANGQNVVRYESYTACSNHEGDIEAFPLWAGQGVGLVTKQQPAAEIVREIAADAERHLAQAAAILQP